ncbi:MAG: glycosyltransferase [Bacteroidetes bacterium]|nr:glycosyltransferase [Bacteroidota bacterium]
MNILHILSQYEVNGAETYTATLADACIARGDTVTIVSDTFHTKTAAAVLTHPIGKRTYPQRIRNIQYLSTLIREREIDVVHAHSRAAAWVGFFATRVTRIPLVSSIHMRQHLHFSSRHFSVYGEKLIAVCGAIYDHLQNDMKYKKEQLVMVPNGIDCQRWKFRPQRECTNGKKRVAIVGRFTGFKGDALLALLKNVVPRVCAEYPSVEFHIVGGMNDRQKVEREVASINERLGGTYVILRGFMFDIEAVYYTADVIVGAGRVAMEALACGTPVVAVGESSVIGLIRRETAEAAYYSNFGDLNVREPFATDLCVQSLLSILTTPQLHDPLWARSFIEQRYDINEVVNCIRSVYREVQRETQV